MFMLLNCSLFKFIKAFKIMVQIFRYIPLICQWALIHGHSGSRCPMLNGVSNGIN